MGEDMEVIEARVIMDGEVLDVRIPEKEVVQGGECLN
jgi:hypothetical protein